MGEYSTRIIYRDKNGKIATMMAYEWHEIDPKEKGFKYIDAYNIQLRQHRNWAKKKYGIGG